MVPSSALLRARGLGRHARSAGALPPGGSSSAHPPVPRPRRGAVRHAASFLSGGRSAPAVALSADDFFDSAHSASSGGCGGSRPQPGLEDELLLLATSGNPQEWQEMVSLLSFDGEEHKRVTRHMHGPVARVEDMFASFDGDDFEAVMRAASAEAQVQADARGGAAASADGADAAAAGGKQGQQGQQQQQGQREAAGRAGGAPAGAHSSAGGSGAQSLYTSVCATRAAALAAELESKRCPAPRRRQAPLGSQASGDAWLLQVSFAGQPPCPAPGGQQQGQAPWQGEGRRPAGREQPARPLNNIVSSALGSKLRLAAAAARGAWVASVAAAAGAAAGAQLEATVSARPARCAASPQRAPASSAAALSVAVFAPSEASSAEGLLDSGAKAGQALAARQARAQYAAAAAGRPDSAHAAPRQWSRSRTRGLRRALARLRCGHATSPAQE